MSTGQFVVILVVGLLLWFIGLQKIWAMLNELALKLSENHKQIERKLDEIQKQIHRGS